MWGQNQMNMKNLQEVKNEVFNEPDYMIHEDIDWVINEVAKRYAIEVSKEALNKARDLMKYEYSDYEETADFDLIISEQNLPELI